VDVSSACKEQLTIAQLANQPTNDMVQLGSNLNDRLLPFIWLSPDEIAAGQGGAQTWGILEWGWVMMNLDSEMSGFARYSQSQDETGRTQFDETGRTQFDGCGPLGILFQFETLPFESNVSATLRV